MPVSALVWCGLFLLLLWTWRLGRRSQAGRRFRTDLAAMALFVLALMALLAIRSRTALPTGLLWGYAVAIPLVLGLKSPSSASEMFLVAWGLWPFALGLALTRAAMDLLGAHWWGPALLVGSAGMMVLSWCEHVVWMLRGRPERAPSLDPEQVRGDAQVQDEIDLQRRLNSPEAQDGADKYTRE